MKLGDQFQREGQKPRYEVEKGEEHEAGKRTRSLMGKLRITDEQQSEHVRNGLEEFWRLRPDAAEGF